jgi:lipid-A-disaccharide synthase-like uncharacterized protein
MNAPRKPIPLRYWSLWMALLGAALVVFYAILTPVWMVIRAIAWVSEHPRLRFSARRGG